MLVITIPEVKFNEPLIVISPSKLIPVLLLIVTLLKVLAAIFCAKVPLYSAVEPEFKVKPPVAVMFPAIAPEVLVEPSFIVPPLLTATEPAPETTLVPQTKLPVISKAPVTDNPLVPKFTVTVPPITELDALKII